MSDRPSIKGFDHFLHEWLTDWLIDWMIDQIIDWLIGSSHELHGICQEGCILQNSANNMPILFVCWSICQQGCQSYVAYLHPLSQYVNLAKTLPCLSQPPPAAVRDKFIFCPFCSSSPPINPLPALFRPLKFLGRGIEGFYFVAFCCVWSRVWITPLLQRFGGRVARACGKEMMGRRVRNLKTEYKSWNIRSLHFILDTSDLRYSWESPSTSHLELGYGGCQKNADNQLFL